ncbi:MAG: hypothetical protein ACI9ES_001530 [Oceanospirillaceae bacterium]|jgi:hypothetical protein
MPLMSSNNLNYSWWIALFCMAGYGVLDPCSLWKKRTPPSSYIFIWTKFKKNWQNELPINGYSSFIVVYEILLLLRLIK